MIECALVFDDAGEALYWHLPAGRSAVAIPDSRRLWEVMWEARARLGGVAHTHPGGGAADPSREDLTTFAACEAALGRRLKWVIVNADESAQHVWVGPGRLDYARASAVLAAAHALEELKRASLIEKAERLETEEEAGR